MHDGVRGPLTISIALTVNAAVAPVGPVASTVMFEGSVRSGAVASMTVAVNVPAALLRLRPWSSSARSSS